MGTQRTASLPPEGIEFALIRPIIHGFTEAGPDGIVAYVFPFLIVIFVASQAVMPTQSLPWACARELQATEPTFPICYPRLNRNFHVMRRAEKMNMIGHQDIAPDLPRMSIFPN